MCHLLSAADFAHTLRVTVLNEENEVFIGLGDFAMPGHRGELLNGRNFVGLSTAGHTMEWYRRLPYGWRTTPTDIPTDWYMWHQILSVEPCRAVSGSNPSVIGLAQHLRKNWSFERRQKELLYWEEFSRDPDGAMKLSQITLKWLLVRRAELEKGYLEQQKYNAWLEKQRFGWEQQANTKDVEIRRLDEQANAKDVEIRRLGAECARFSSNFQNVLQSTSWQITRPLRIVAATTKRFARNFVLRSR